MDPISASTATELSKIHPWLGYAASSIFLITTVATLINNYRTKQNTLANEAMAKLLSEAESRFNAAAETRLKEFKAGIEGFRESVDKAVALFEKESEDYKLKVMHLKQEVDAHLTRIPRVQDAVAHLDQKVKELDKRGIETAVQTGLTAQKLEEILVIVRRARGKP